MAINAPTAGNVNILIPKRIVKNIKINTIITNKTDIMVLFVPCLRSNINNIIKKLIAIIKYNIILM
jgi:hypothetical protein